MSTEVLGLNAVVSPDGRWIAYVASSSGENQVYVQPFPDVGSGLSQLSSDGGWEPRWAPDGERFVMERVSDASRLDLVVVERWATDLAKLAPID